MHAANEARPVTAAERNLSGWDFFLLWAGASIALSEIWAGGILAPLGFALGLLANLLGHALGNLPMALCAVVGARHGVPAIVSTRAALGVRGSWLAAALNITQLVGWTAVMLWIGGSAAARVCPAGFPLGEKGWIVLAGVLTTLWALGGHRVWRPLQRAGVVLLLVLSAGMTWLVLRTYGLGNLLAKPAAPDVGFMLKLDFVIAMPVSWLPLVADYARYARTGRGAFAGTWTGYFLGSSWMFLVGLCAALATGSDDPAGLVMELLAGAGRGWLVAAILVVLLSTLTTTFLNIFSNAMSVQSLFPSAGAKPLILAGGAAGTLIALVFPGLGYEGFLLLIGSAFCPLFGVVLADYFLLRRGRYDADALFDRGGGRYRAGIHWPGLAAWIAGIAVYHVCARTGFPAGSSIPAMLGAGAVYLGVARGREGSGVRGQGS